MRKSWYHQRAGPRHRRTTACASKGFVKNQVGQVSGKVDSLGQSLEETQERTKQNEAKIGEVDQKTAAAQQAATAAQDAATTADQKAVAATDAAQQVNAPRRRTRQGVQAPDVHRRAERRRRQLQVQQHLPAR